MIANKQIGWSQEEILLWEISRELDKLLCSNTVCTTTTLPPTQLRMLFNDINAVGDPNDLNTWNSFFQLPTFGNPFTSFTIIGNEIFLFGGSNITIVSDIFTESSNILEIEDVTSNVIIGTNIKTFSNATLLTTVILPAILIISGESFKNCTSLIELNISSCTNLGPTVGDDLVFDSTIGNTITLTVPSALMTCNSGSPDGDIQYLQANNTVTIITV
jgi:hypothetical protein